jgi:hypothetical protein
VSLGSFPAQQTTTSPSKKPSRKPTSNPSSHPSSKPSPRPTSKPSPEPTPYPSCQPTSENPITENPIPPTFSSSVSCPFFSTTYSSDCTAADAVCPSCSFTACPSTTIQVQLTNAEGFTYQYFTIYSPSGRNIFSSYIAEGSDVAYTFDYDGDCTSFTLVATCDYYGESCSGAYVIGGAIAEPSSAPSTLPTGPSVSPTSLRPTTTMAPSGSPTSEASIECPFYHAYNTSLATKVHHLIELTRPMP